MRKLKRTTAGSVEETLKVLDRVKTEFENAGLLKKKVISNSKTNYGEKSGGYDPEKAKRLRAKDKMNRKPLKSYDAMMQAAGKSTIVKPEDREPYNPALVRERRAQKDAKNDAKENND